jgi:molybdate transport system substrate-binding protein
MRRSSKSLFIFSCFIVSLVVAINLSLTPKLQADADTDSKSNYNKSTAEIIVSAAASLQDSLGSIQQLYQKANPSFEVNYNFGSSGSLQQQIERGAPVDIFISAAAKQMDELEKKDLILNETRKNLLKNKLVLIVPKENKIISSFKDLATDRVKTFAMGEPESVPAGKYSQEVLNYLKIFDRVRSKAVYGKDVRQVLNYVATGNVDAGIVYLTDTKTSDRIRIVVAADEKTHSPIVYPVAVVKDSKHIREAKEYISFLASSEAKKILTADGFIPIE